MARMKFVVVPMTEEYARQIVAWRYDPPYSIYDISAESVDYLLEDANHYHAVIGGEEALVGYCCFGEEATVPGGSYPEQEPQVLDVGVGMHPDLTGKGHSKQFLGAILAYAASELSAKRFRVTIAAFNQRSQMAFKNMGFVATHEFKRPSDQLGFIQFEKPNKE